ncbi:hypothetical protein [Phytohabitans kaempferiae]|uniref:LysM domain-containing protein n=1 Tax=Phytohabitans kaempferiae TaxID=1620943 RepID=A0ABV6M940_9ACTN
MRPRHPTQHVLVMVVKCVVVLLGAVLLGAAPAAAAPTDEPVPPRTEVTETGKYYVVGPAVNGQREFLFAIAAKTLGDGRRYREIFDLNEGRPQPDGGQMVDATTVEPGWILILPADAQGPDVITGALPGTTRSTAAPSGPDAASGGTWLTTGLRITLLVLAALFVIWAQVTLWARHRRRPVATGPSIATDPAEQPPAAESAGSPAPPPVSQAEGPPGQPVLAGNQAVPPMPALGPAVLRPATTPNPFAVLTTELTCSDRPAQVRLIGSRPGRWGSAYRWLSGDQQPPPATVPLILGEQDDRRLWADLAHAPDALTVGGDPAAARRHAVTLVSQLNGETDVVVIGDALGDVLPSAARWLPAPADLDAGRSMARIRVVVCSAADAPALRRQLRDAKHGGRRTVSLIVGPAPAARWSIQLGVAGRRRPTAEHDSRQPSSDQSRPLPADRT